MKNLKLVIVGLLAALSIAQAAPQTSVERKLTLAEIGAVKSDPVRSKNIRRWAHQFVLIANDNIKYANATDIKKLMIGKVLELDTLLKRYKGSELVAYQEEKVYLMQLINGGQLAKARDHVASVRTELDKVL